MKRREKSRAEVGNVIEVIGLEHEEEISAVHSELVFEGVKNATKQKFEFTPTVKSTKSQSLKARKSAKNIMKVTKKIPNLT